MRHILIGLVIASGTAAALVAQTTSNAPFKLGTFERAEDFLRDVSETTSESDLAEALSIVTRELGFTYFALTHHVDIRRAPQPAIRSRSRSRSPRKRSTTSARVSPPPAGPRNRTASAGSTGRT